MWYDISLSFRIKLGNPKNVFFNLFFSFIYTESSSGNTESREDRVARQVREMLSKTPMPFDLFDVKQALIAAGATSSMNIFLRQEIDRMQRV